MIADMLSNVKAASAYSDRPVRHNYEPGQTVLMRDEQSTEAGDLGLTSSSLHTEEDYPSMRKALSGNKIAKIAIVGDKDAPFSVGDRKNLVVSEGLRIITSNGRHIVSLTHEPGRQPELRTFVEQELHRDA